MISAKTILKKPLPVKETAFPSLPARPAHTKRPDLSIWLFGSPGERTKRQPCGLSAKPKCGEFLIRKEGQAPPGLCTTFEDAEWARPTGEQKDQIFRSGFLAPQGNEPSVSPVGCRRSRSAVSSSSERKGRPLRGSARPLRMRNGLALPGNKKTRSFDLAFWLPR